MFEEKEVQDFPHDGGYTAKQEIFVVMKNTDREGSSRQIFGINTVEDMVQVLANFISKFIINYEIYKFVYKYKDLWIEVRILFENKVTVCSTFPWSCTNFILIDGIEIPKVK